MNEIGKGRRTLILVALVFIAPITLASLLALSGWMPKGRRNYGELIDPPLRVEAVTTLADGGRFVWATPQWHWTVLLRIPPTCDRACREHLDQVGNLRISMGRHAEKIRIAVDQPIPSDSVLGRAQGVYVLSDVPSAIDERVHPARTDLTLALFDPAGYLILRYPEHADLSRVRKDFGKLIR